MPKKRGCERNKRPFQKQWFCPYKSSGFTGQKHCFSKHPKTASLPVWFPQAPKILQRTRIADAMALRAPRCRLCASQGLPSPPHPHESAGRFTPVFKRASQNLSRDARSPHIAIVYRCLSIAYLRLSERQPVGCHLQARRRRVPRG